MTDDRPMDGQAFWEWLMGRADAVRQKSRALATAHKLGYSPRIWTWSPAQVQAVRGRLGDLPPPWGGAGPVRGAGPG